jgi:hypothetical protein
MIQGMSLAISLTVHRTFSDTFEFEKIRIESLVVKLAGISSSHELPTHSTPTTHSGLPCTLVESSWSLHIRLLVHSYHINRNGIELEKCQPLVLGVVRMDAYPQALQQVLGLAIDIQLPTLRVLCEVEGRNLRHVLILSLALLLLQLEGNAPDRTALDTLHEMSGVTRDLDRVSLDISPLSTASDSLLYLIAKSLRGDDCDLITDALVRLEIEGEFGIVALDDDLCRLFHGLRPNATHLGGLEGVVKRLKVDLKSRGQRNNIAASRLLNLAGGAFGVQPYGPTGGAADAKPCVVL